MSDRPSQRKPTREFRYRVLTLVFGAIPATVFCFWALVTIILGITQLPSFGGALMMLLSGAVLFGTYSLWMVAFGHKSRLVAVMATLAVPVLVLFMPVWATPVAKLWYRSGFESAATEALAEISGSEKVCIYDDARNMFVRSVVQLDVEQMIEKAVRDKASVRIPLPITVQRDPHFRVYSGGRTYYWSFRNEELHAFRGDRWTLAGGGLRGTLRSV